MNYVLTPEAEAELLDAATFYAQNVSTAVAENFLAPFEQKARLIAEFAGIGTPGANRRRPGYWRKVS